MPLSRKWFLKFSKQLKNMKKQKTKIQLSLFPRYFCEVCGDKLTHNGTTCEPCAKKWVEAIELEGFKVFKNTTKK